MMEKNKRLLLIAPYGLELVECGGALLKNDMCGGTSHAVILFSSETMKDDILKAAEILHTSVEFLNLDPSEINCSIEEKLKLVRVLRQQQPDIIITQDPEHAIKDFDPGRRPAMALILESLSLAGRGFGMEYMPELKPYSQIGTIYYMSPEKPNCVVDIHDVQSQKFDALRCMQDQLQSCGEYFSSFYTKEELLALIPEWNTLAGETERGMVILELLYKSQHLAQDAPGHCALLASEAYRHEGLFCMSSLD